MAHAVIPRTYLGASEGTNIWAPTALPTQYATKSVAEVTVFLVLPATLDGRNVQITRKSSARRLWKSLRALRLTESRKRTENLEDVHSPARPFHAVGREERKRQHPSKGRDKGEHHQHNYSCTGQTRDFEAGKWESLTSEVRLLQSGHADRQEPENADAVVRRGSF